MHTPFSLWSVLSIFESIAHCVGVVGAYSYSRGKVYTQGGQPQVCGASTGALQPWTVTEPTAGQEGACMPEGHGDISILENTDSVGLVTVEPLSLWSSTPGYTSRIQLWGAWRWFWERGAVGVGLQMGVTTICMCAWCNARETLQVCMLGAGLTRWWWQMGGPSCLYGVAQTIDT